jgi:hypothetical protein
VNEVDVLAFNGRLEVRQAVEPLLLRAPIEPIEPVVGKVAHE